MPRKRHVSRNDYLAKTYCKTQVMPRKRHVSRNAHHIHGNDGGELVMPRKRHVSRNCDR